MKYPKNDCCIDIPDNCDNSENIGNSPNMGQKQMLQQINEMKFAVIDLNLYLDTHPNDQEALTLFKKIAGTLESLMYDYQTKYGPLYAWNASTDTPFDWVSPSQKWPWEL